MIDLSEAALDVLSTLDKNGAYLIPDTSAMQPLWDERYVMGDKSKANITIRGQGFIRKWDKGQRG